VASSNSVQSVSQDCTVDGLTWMPVEVFIGPDSFTVWLLIWILTVTVTVTKEV
jgi:hypothetical protein